MSMVTISAEELHWLKGNISALQARHSESEKNPFNSGDTAWLLTSSALVLLMTLPGLALFYGGMSQAKNVLSTVFQTYSIACMITLQWVAVTYSVCFYSVSPILGGADRLWLIGTQDTANQKSPHRLGPHSIHPLAPTIPESVFIMFQLTFAIITPALVCGSLAERMKFEAVLLFIFLWHFAVYCPICHAEWGPGGFLATAGDLDFAGGNVVHITSGFSGLAASIVLGPRKGFGVLSLRPHNVIYSVIGGALLWVGWFGFNAGSATTAGGTAGFAMMVTHISGSTGGFVWMLIEYAHKGKPSILGIVSGTVCGLVVITPASGYVDHTAAVVMSLISTPIVYFGLQFKERVGYDDALDAFGVHGVGGLCGGLLTGFFANDFVSGSLEKRGVFYGKGDQVWIQLYGLVVIASWSFALSLAILLCIKHTLGLRVTEDQEERGLDITQHGESMSQEWYDDVEARRDSVRPPPPAPPGTSAAAASDRVRVWQTKVAPLHPEAPAAPAGAGDGPAAAPAAGEAAAGGQGGGGVPDTPPKGYLSPCPAPYSGPPAAVGAGEGPAAAAAGAAGAVDKVEVFAAAGGPAVGDDRGGAPSPVPFDGAES